MSRAELIAATCVGKHPFASKVMAMKVARRMKGGTDVFRCPYCHKFHIGHRDPIK